MSRRKHAGDIHDHLKAQGYDLDGISLDSDGTIRLDAPRETPARRQAAKALAEAMPATITEPMSYMEALGRHALNPNNAAATAIITAEVQRLRDERIA
ncbi:hypothetical protein OAF54_03150 [bacterium]|nr:hypothetical protein [bacterium]